MRAPIKYVVADRQEGKTERLLEWMLDAPRDTLRVMVCITHVAAEVAFERWAEVMVSRGAAVRGTDMAIRFVTRQRYVRGEMDRLWAGRKVEVCIDDFDPLGDIDLAYVRNEHWPVLIAINGVML